MAYERITKKHLQQITDDYGLALGFARPKHQFSFAFRRNQIVAQAILLNISRDRKVWSISYCAYVLAYDVPNDRGLQLYCEDPGPRYNKLSLEGHKRVFEKSIAEARVSVRPKLDSPLDPEDFIPFCYGRDLQAMRVRGNVALASIQAWLGRKEEALNALKAAEQHGANDDWIDGRDWLRFRPFVEEFRTRMHNHDLREWLLSLADARMKELEQA